MTKSLLFPAMITGMIMAGCNTVKDSSATSSSGVNALGWNEANETPVNDSITLISITGSRLHGGVMSGNREAADLPLTRIYKTNGDYTDCVPVTLNQARNALVSYPAPSDLRDCQPVQLKDGFLLDRRGIGINTAFTRWTYKEYASLENAPSPEEIMGNIIPESRVTQLYEMPFPIGTPDAAARCDSLITAGLPGCKSLILSLRM